MDQQQKGQNHDNNQQTQNQNQKTSQQRSEKNQDHQQQFKEKKNQSESNNSNKICKKNYQKQQARPQSMVTSIQSQQINELNNTNNEQEHQGILDQQGFKVEGKNQDLIRSNQTTLTTLPQNIKQYMDEIDNKQASKLLQQYQDEEQQNEFVDLISEINIEDQKIDEQQLQNFEGQRKQQYDQSESESEQIQKIQIILSENEIPQQNNKMKMKKKKKKQSRRQIKIEDAQFIDQKGVPIEKLDIFKQKGPVLYNPHYKFYKEGVQQNQIPEQIQQDKPEQSSIILTAIYPIDEAESESDNQSNQEIENEKQINKEIDQKKDEEEVGIQLLKKRRQKDFQFLEPESQSRDIQSSQREIKKLSQDELIEYSKQRLNRESIQYERNQKLKQELRKQNGTDNIPEETIEEKCKRLTSKFEEKLQILPQDDVIAQVQYLKRNSTFKRSHLNAMDQQRAIWLKHGFIGHLKPKVGFRFHQLYEKTDEYLIDEDDPYGIKSPFVPQPEDKIKFERLHQQQLKDSSSLAYKNYAQMLALGGKTIITPGNQINTSNNSLFSYNNQQQINPFMNNQIQNNLFQNNPINNLFQNNATQNTLFQNNPIQNNLFLNNPIQNNIFQNNPIQNNIFLNNSNNVFQSKITNPFQNNQQQSQNNPFLNSLSTGNKTNNVNQQPVQNIFGLNNQVPNIFNQQGRLNNTPQTFKQSQSPVRYRINSYQNNINQQSNWNKNSLSNIQQPIKEIQNPFQTNTQQGQTQQPFKLAFNPFQPHPIATQNNVNKLPDIFQPQSNLTIPPLQNVFAQNPSQNVQNQGTNRYNTRPNNKTNNFR